MLVYLNQLLQSYILVPKGKTMKIDETNIDRLFREPNSPHCSGRCALPMLEVVVKAFMSAVRDRKQDFGITELRSGRINGPCSAEYLVVKNGKFVDIIITDTDVSTESGTYVWVVQGIEFKGDVEAAEQLGAAFRVFVRSMDIVNIRKVASRLMKEKDPGGRHLKPDMQREYAVAA